MGNRCGALIITAAAYWIIFGSILIQPGLSLNPAHDDVIKPAAERKYTPILGTKSSSSAPPLEEEEKKKPDAGQLIDPKPKSSTDRLKTLSPADDRSKLKPKSGNAEQHHKHHHKHKNKLKNKQKEGRSSKLKPKSETKKDLSQSPSPSLPPRRSASPPKQARESSSLPKTITPAPAKATKKLDNQSSTTKTPKSSTAAATHEKPARAPASSAALLGLRGKKQQKFG